MIKIISDLKILFKQCADGIQVPSNPNERDFFNLYSVMNAMNRDGLAAIKQYTGNLLLNTYEDNLLLITLLKKLESIVSCAYGNIQQLITGNKVSENDSEVLISKTRIIDIAVVVSQIRDFSNKETEQKDRDSLRNLFETCMRRIEEKFAEKSRKKSRVYAIMNKMRQEGSNKIQENTKMSVLIDELREIMLTALKAIESLPKVKKKFLFQ